ncbi:MAG: 4Fe-4S dicluster domain-containing protein [Bdellovibrionales bacterium]|nr:4Fe-4S dicluster domain-containing protein [Bdellovibrionales bacterium]
MPDYGKRLQKSVEQSLGMPIRRRSFLKGLLAGGAAATVPLKTANAFSWETFFQKHYKEMTSKDKERVFKRIKAEVKKKYQVDPVILDPAPMDGVRFAFCLNLSKCNGSRYCVSACVKENNQGREPEMQYIKVIEMEMGSLNLERGDLYYNAESVPRDGKFYLPAQCNQCEKPPCTKVCPVEATWKEPDGIVVIDYDWCIGCRYCMSACPYEARRFNFTEPKVPQGDINPNQGYLSNRMRPKGVVEKCHFCLHRTRNGQYPACLEACPTGARKFGDLNDPNSEVSKVLKTKRVFVLKEELNTIPRFFYYFD